MSTYVNNLKHTYLVKKLSFSQLQGCFTQLKSQPQCLNLSRFLLIICNILVINIGFGT